ncbi:zinc finger protein 567-like [Anopheles bellator]|uniref:zinc finger protein 567-like n=1 Tax=Anopheles bellator TaxID=139047 RepID=UPI002647AA98|nr:zinc finger protein 567-like [Anopheles bellator]
MEAIKTEFIPSPTPEKIIEPPSATSLQKCSVCLKNGQCLKASEVKTNGKHITDVIRQHLGIKLAEFELTTICQRCWMLLAEFDKFYNMVNEAHRVLLETNIVNVQRRPSLNDVGEENICAMEFVAIKQEPLDDEHLESNDLQITLKNEIVASTSQRIAIETSANNEEDIEVSILDADDKKRLLNLREMSTDNVEEENSKLTTNKSRKKKYLTNTGRTSKSKVDEEIISFYKRLVCEICDPVKMASGEPLIEFVNLKELNRHMRRAHGQGEAIIKCPICEKKFRSRVKLVQHKEMHLNPDQFRCELCAEVHQNIKDHMQNKHKERTFCCEECGKRFPFQTRLKAHIRKMHTVKDVPCDQCDKAFSKYTIEDHKRAVHGAGFICEHCPRKFKSRFQLDNHMEEHSVSLRSTKVSCDVCGIVVRNKYNLTTHMKRMHMEHAPVSCGSCGKEFKSKRNLDAHLTNVCTDRSFPCTICGKPFKKKIKLKEHMTTHTKSPLYQCPYCPKTFSFETQLYTHRKQAHYEQWLEMQRRRKEGVRFRVNRVPN